MNYSSHSLWYITILIFILVSCKDRSGLVTNLKTHTIQAKGSQRLQWIWIKEIKESDAGCVEENTLTDTITPTYVNEGYRNSILYEQASINSPLVDMKQLNKEYPILFYKEFTPSKNDLKFYRYDRNEFKVDSIEIKTTDLFKPYHTYMITFPGYGPNNVYSSNIVIVTFDHDLSVRRWVQKKTLIKDKNTGRSLRNL